MNCALGSTRRVIKVTALKRDWYELADQGEYSYALLEFVRAYQPATFDEVADCLGNHIEIVGDHVLRLARNPDVILWSSMSLQLVQLIGKLIGDDRVSLHCCESLLYQLNGHVAQVPVIQYIPIGRLAEPSWLPCVLTTKDHDSDATVVVDEIEWN